MFDVGGFEFIVIILAIILLFGPKALPDLARQMGKGLRQFRKAQEDLTQQIRDISADAAVREALDMTPTTVIRPPSGGVPVSRTEADSAASAEQPPSTTTAGSEPLPDAGPDASLSGSSETPESSSQP